MGQRFLFGGGTWRTTGQMHLDNLSASEWIHCIFPASLVCASNCRLCETAAGEAARMNESLAGQDLLLLPESLTFVSRSVPYRFLQGPSIGVRLSYLSLSAIRLCDFMLGSFPECPDNGSSTAKLPAVGWPLLCTGHRKVSRFS